LKFPLNSILEIISMHANKALGKLATQKLAISFVIAKPDLDVGCTFSPLAASLAPKEISTHDHEGLRVLSYKQRKRNTSNTWPSPQKI
jgi:hypothetical protein